jgi:transposase
MTTMTPEPGSVTGGVDSHLEVHVAAAVDHLGGLLGTESFPTTAAGYRRLLAWLVSFGPVHAVGVEGTGSYGCALARHLAEHDVPVIEVSRPNRQVRRRHGKSDVIDAIAAARAVLSGQATATPKAHDGPVEALRLLKIVARSATKSRTQAVNQLRTIVATAPDQLRSKLRELNRAQLVTTCAAFRVDAQDDSLPAVTRLALRELAQRIQLLDQQLARTKTRLARITTAVAPQLVARKGVGPDTASAILIAAGDNPQRLRDERSFAALAGSSPIPASSGKTTRHRLNRGGDRQLNAALWRIAMVRLATDPDTRAYLARRTAQGKTKPEAIRCIKRYLAREIFAALPQTHGPLTVGASVMFDPAVVPPDEHRGANDRQNRTFEQRSTAEPSPLTPWR